MTNTELDLIDNAQKAHLSTKIALQMLVIALEANEKGNQRSTDDHIERAIDYLIKAQKYNKG